MEKYLILYTGIAVLIVVTVIVAIFGPWFKVKENWKFLTMDEKENWKFLTMDTTGQLEYTTSPSFTPKGGGFDRTDLLKLNGSLRINKGKTLTVGAGLVMNDPEFTGFAYRDGTYYHNMEVNNKLVLSPDDTKAEGRLGVNKGGIDMQNVNGTSTLTNLMADDITVRDNLNYNNPDLRIGNVVIPETLMMEMLDKLYIPSSPYIFGNADLFLKELDDFVDVELIRS